MPDIPTPLSNEIEPNPEQLATQRLLDEFATLTGFEDNKATLMEFSSTSMGELIPGELQPNGQEAKLYFDLTAMREYTDSGSAYSVYTLTIQAEQESVDPLVRLALEDEKGEFNGTPMTQAHILTFEIDTHSRQLQFTEEVLYFDDEDDEELVGTHSDNEEVEVWYSPQRSHDRRLVNPSEPPQQIVPRTVLMRRAQEAIPIPAEDAEDAVAQWSSAEKMRAAIDTPDRIAQTELALITLQRMIESLEEE